MTSHRLRLTALAWCALLSILILVIRLTTGGTVGTGTLLLILAVAILPPAVAILVFRGAPPKSINEVLYDTEQAPARVPAGRGPRDRA